MHATKCQFSSCDPISPQIPFSRLSRHVLVLGVCHERQSQGNNILDDSQYNIFSNPRKTYFLAEIVYKLKSTIASPRKHVQTEKRLQRRNSQLVGTTKQEYISDARAFSDLVSETIQRERGRLNRFTKRIQHYTTHQIENNRRKI